MKPQNYDRTLRRILLGNAIFSTITGGFFAMFAAGIADWMGLTAELGTKGPAAIFWIGISVLLFAVGIFVNTLRSILNIREAYITAVMDVGWVVGSTALLFGGWINFSSSGWWLIAGIADIVAVFAVLQLYALRKHQLPEAPRLAGQIN